LQDYIPIDIRSTATDTLMLSPLDDFCERTFPSVFDLCRIKMIERNSVSEPDCRWVSSRCRPSSDLVSFVSTRGLPSPARSRSGTTQKHDFVGQQHAAPLEAHFRRALLGGFGAVYRWTRLHGIGAGQNQDVGIPVAVEILAPSARASGSVGRFRSAIAASTRRSSSCPRRRTPSARFSSAILRLARSVP
jgi:hypothetical protein